MDLKNMRKDITTLIDDIKYQSDSLSDLDRLPIIQLNVLLAKMNMLTRKTTILHHYVELECEKQKILRNEDQINTEVDDVPAQTEEVESAPMQQLVEPEAVKPQAREEKKKQGNVEDRLKQIAIVDLTTAIGINEKYLLASELFGGNIETYKEAILRLNSFESWEQAKVFLDELSVKFKWDQENELVLNFRNLVERRYYQD
jgi:hypothetical protein